jgi:cytochrome c-type biogenesis protein
MPLAFAAGLVSFISPCVLPLVPGYLAFLSGTTGELGPRGRGRALAGSFAFIIGFALVFVSAGALFGQFGSLLRTHLTLLDQVFGVLTVVMGMFFAGFWPSKWLQRERRVHFLPPASVLGASALGVLFGLGWTPCIGPTLATILGLAATSGATAFRGSFLAFIYCLGLGLPFVVAALATEWMATTSRWLKGHMQLIGRIGGLFLILIGIAEVSGLWHIWVTWLQIHFPSTTIL